MTSFRLLTYRKMIANAGLLNTVEEALGGSSTSPAAPPPEPFKALGSVGPGTTVLMPPNCVKNDDSVDIVINIRGIAGGDTKTAGSLGINAVVITAEGGGLGSAENQKAFGNAAFVNHAVSSVLSSLQKQFPDKNIHRGKLIISGFSGGGGAIASILSQKNNVNGNIDGIIINDGLHANPGTPEMNAVLDYAKEAQKDPTKKFRLVHTAVDPGKYISTTDTANYLVNQLNLQRNPVSEDWSGVGPKPVSQANSGGVQITQLYDKQQPYMAADANGKVRPNVLGKTSGGQHISSLQWMPNAFKGIV